LIEPRKAAEGIRPEVIFEESPDALMGLSTEGVVLSWNRGACEMFGFSIDEVIGQNIVDVIVPENDRARVRRMVNEATDRGDVSFEAIRQRKDGAPLNVLVSMRRVDREEAPILAVSETDLTKLDRLRGELTEANYRSLLEAAPDAVIVLNEDGQITLVNFQTEVLFGYTRAELLGQKVDLLIPEWMRGGHRARHASFFEPAPGAPASSTVELIAVRKDSQSLPVEISLRPLRSGEQVFLYGSVRDVSERKRLEHRLHETNRLKSEFLANMSHELRTPLNAIIGFADLLHRAKAGPLTPSQEEYLGDILTSSQHLLRLIDDVLDLAKVESGKMEFRTTTVDLAKLVTEVRDIVRGLAASKRLRIEVAVEPEAASAVIDPVRVKQILYNYLSNAIKFTPEKGKITVRVLPQGPDFFKLEVEDTGIGVAEAEFGKLFVEFQQLDGGSGKKYQGTGLGLALTKRIVEAHGGRVAVRSVVGHGSTFSAVLPRVMSSPPQENTEEKEEPHRGSSLPESTILVVEDVAADRRWLVDTLRSAGFAVEIAETGAEAIARSHARRFGAITLDLDLPDMNGWDVLHEMRSLALNRDTPVIAVTVCHAQGSAAAFRLHDYLTKPLPEEELVASLTSAGLRPADARPVLVIDDDPGVLKLVDAMLEEQGYRSICVSDVEDAVKAAISEPPALVLLDLAIPGVDGFEFVSRLRRDYLGNDVPIVVWTVKDLTAAERETIRAASNSIVSKSSGNMTELIAELRPLLAGPGCMSGVKNARTDTDRG
jgi:PAS domain S-box-containing protein